jgi:hypothetical protein
MCWCQYSGATLGVSVMTLHRWRKALLGARPAHKADQIALLHLENSLLRRLVTDLLLLENIKRRKATLRSNMRYK